MYIIHTDMRIYIHTYYIHTYIRMYIHTYIAGNRTTVQVYTHTRAHTHTHTHTHTQHVISTESEGCISCALLCLLLYFVYKASLW